MSGIRLGVVGFGHRISGVTKLFQQVAPDLKVAALVDPDEEGARARLTEADRKDVVFYPTLDAMVRRARLDALAIGTRCNLHTPYAIEAARYDLPLYLEKPVAISMKQALALEKAYRKTRCRVLVSFPLLVSPLCQLAHGYIRDGAVGDPLHIQAVNYVPYGACYWEGHYRNYAVTQGLFLQKATHDFDYMSFLMGASITRVAAMMIRGRVAGGTKRAGLHCAACAEDPSCLESARNRFRTGATKAYRDHACMFSRDAGNLKQGLNEDCSSALLEFANGSQGVYSQVFYARRDAAARGATVSGYRGTVSFDWYQNELKRIRHHEPFTAVEKAAEGMSHFGGDLELAFDFVDMVRDRRKHSRTPIERGLQSVYACLAARASAETGRFAEVRQVGF
jgi:predicted dehydrogenase